MKTIEIFLASSEELTDDRNAFGNLVRRLDKIYEKRGSVSSSSSGRAMTLPITTAVNRTSITSKSKPQILFHIKAGKFTLEEFDIATKEFYRHASPKVYIYCKDLKDGEQELPELAGFKKRLFEEMGHYWSHYNNCDSMQLHFLMQL